MQYLIVPTSHIARQAQKDIKKAYDKFQPDVIAVELDKHRLFSLLSKQKPNYSLKLMRQVGARGYLFAVIGGFIQRKLGKIVNMTPGADMLAAVKLAKEEKKMLLLIDQDIQITLKKLSKAMGFRELKQFIKDGWNSIWKREKITITLSKTPSPKTVQQLINLFKDRYPRPYKVLVEERNHVMVRSLKRYHTQHPEQKILIVVGAGHASGMEDLLSNL